MLVPKKRVESGCQSSPRSKTNTADEEAALLSRIAVGDVVAYEAVIDAHLGPVMALARRMLGDDDEAEDIAQETFLRLWRHAAKFDPKRARLSTWLHRIASNVCIDRMRSRRGGHELIGDHQQHPELRREAGQDRAFLERQLAMRVDGALQGIPERQRLALVLCYYQGLTMKDAADVMEVSVEAIESLLARARRALKKDLAEEWRALLPDGDV